MKTSATSIMAQATPVARPASSTFLSRVLRIDAATSAAMGLLLLAASPWLEPLLGLPCGLLRASGAVLLPFAVGLVVLAAQASPAAAAVWTVIALNALWTLGSLLLLIVPGPLVPTALGQAFVFLQAAVVALFAALEFTGWRRMAR